MFSSFSRTLFKRAIKPRTLSSLPVRGIKLHEYQAAKLLSSYGVPIPEVSISHSRFMLLAYLHIFREMLHSIQTKLIVYLKISKIKLMAEWSLKHR